MLTSPRFTSSRTLQNAASNTPPLRKGARGRGVHLLQMALIDLGHRMPRSTGNALHSPDGIFGEETFAVVRQFQRDNRLKDDGVVGRNTMSALDRRVGRYQHRVRLHFRSIALTDVAFSRILADTETVYGQYGIKVEFASGESLGLTPEQMELFEQIDQECNWELNDGEFNMLHGLGTAAPPNEVLVYYVRAFGEANLLGCGGHARNRPALTVAARASRWDTAHELGHVLLGSAFSPVHTNDQRNLMYPFSSTGTSIPMLTHGQLAQMRRSACCHRA